MNLNPGQKGLYLVYELQQEWQRQRPAAQQMRNRHADSDRRKLVCSRCGTLLVAQGLKRTARRRLVGSLPK